MRRLLSMTAAAVLTYASLALGGCAVTEKVIEMSRAGIAYYCNAGEAERAAIRQQFTTSKGPLAQVNCENLE